MGFFDDIGAAIGNVATTVTNAITPKSNGGSTPSSADTAKSIVSSASSALSSAGNAASSVLSGVSTAVNTVASIPSAVTKNAVSALAGNTSTEKTSTTNPTTTATTSNWNPTYYAVDQSGNQFTQTWKDTNSGVQTAFANISASALSEYFAERGDTSNADMYAQIAAASKGNSIVNTKSTGYMYDAMSGTAYSVSDRYAKNPVVTEYLTAEEGATQQNTAAAVASTNINLYDDFMTTKQDAYTNAIVQISSGNILSGDVAIGAGAMAADVLAPLDLVNVGNKLLTGRGNELEGSDYAFAALDALAIVGGVFSFGTGYVAIKGLKTAAKVAKVGAVGSGITGGAMVLGGE